MCTVMTFSEIGDSLIDLLISGYTDSGLVAGNNLVGTGDEAIFLPLITTTYLPALATNIAAGVSKPFCDCGRIRYQNCALHGQLQFILADFKETILVGVHT